MRVRFNVTLENKLPSVIAWEYAATGQTANADRAAAEARDVPTIYLTRVVELDAVPREGEVVVANGEWPDGVVVERVKWYLDEDPRVAVNLGDLDDDEAGVEDTVGLLLAAGRAQVE